MKNYLEKHKEFQERIQKFKELEEGVDYVKEKTNIDAPLKVFTIKPISDKGRDWFNT